MAKSPGLQPHLIRSRALRALREAFFHTRPAIELDDRGYVPHFSDNLLPSVRPDDFEADLRSGDGNELGSKFRAVHSSSALAVNVFGPFRTRVSKLMLPGSGPFTKLEFERKCPNGVSSRSPNLDLLLEGPEGIVGIESKLTEPLSRHRADFSPKYYDKIRDERRSSVWFREMCRLEENPHLYSWLDAAQLIKHAFGLIRTFPDQTVKLLYLFWEPRNSEDYPLFAEHRHEITVFSESVRDSSLAFQVMSYHELWCCWCEMAPSWISAHIENIKARYELDL